MRWQLYNLDTIPWLIDQSADQFDALVTDPPYSSGGLHTSARTADSANGKYLSDPGKYPEFSGESRDQFSYMQWSTLWLTHAFRVVRPGAPVLVFSDWRQLPVLTSAVQAAGFTWRGIVAWDKTESARPQRGRFRQQCEFVIWGSKGAWEGGDGPTMPGVFRYSVTAGGPKRHTTGKPVPLMADLIRVCPLGTVLDPFAGSASTGVAALQSGRRFVGVEREKAYFEIGCERLSEVD